MRFVDYLSLLVRNFSIKDAWNLCVLPRVAYRLGYKQDLFIANLLKFQRRLIKAEIDKYRSISDYPLRQSRDFKVWTMWWQGRNDMPETIRQCHESLIRNVKGHEVILIDKDNYREYVELPDWLIVKFKQKKIGISHFSDLIRLHLLSKYGGVWVDSALFLVKPLEITEPLFMPSFPKSRAICEGRWWFGLIGAPAHFKLIEFMKESLLKYWHKYDAAVEYLMWDGFMRIAYEELPDIKAYIDRLPRISPQLHDSRYSFMSPADGSFFTELLRRNSCFSLTWRFPYEEEIDNQPTFYSLLIKYSSAVQENQQKNIDEFLKHNRIAVDEDKLRYLRSLKDEELSGEFLRKFKRRSNIYV